MGPFIIIVIILVLSAVFQIYSNNLKKEQQHGKHFNDETLNDRRA